VAVATSGKRHPIRRSFTDMVTYMQRCDNCGYVSSNLPSASGYCPRSHRLVAPTTRRASSVPSVRTTRWRRFKGRSPRRGRAQAQALQELRSCG